MIKTLAVIPARGGSKGLPGKNIVELNGKPLIAWTIEAAKKSIFVTKAVVSSDDDLILKVAAEYGADVIKRPSELALDSSPSEPVVEHAMKILEAEGEEFDYVMLLQPTSPLRTCEDIDSSFRLMLSANADALISVYEPEHTPLKSFKLNDRGFLEGLINNEYPFMRRQDLPKVFMPNGAIYIIKSDIFMKTGKLFCGKTVHYEMPREKSVDVDTAEDINNIKKFMLKSN